MSLFIRVVDVDVLRLLWLQMSLEAVQRELNALQELSSHQKKRSSEILSLLIRDLSDIGAALELKAVRTKGI